MKLSQGKVTRDRDLRLPGDSLSTWIQPCLKFFEPGNNIVYNSNYYIIIHNYITYYILLLIRIILVIYIL